MTARRDGETVALADSEVTERYAELPPLYTVIDDHPSTSLRPNNGQQRLATTFDGGPQAGQSGGTNALPHSQNPVTAQPRRVVFNEASMSVLQHMQSCNRQAAQQLNSLVGNIAANLENRTAQDISLMPNELDYDYLLSTLLLPGEQVVTEMAAQIHHSQVLMRDDAEQVKYKLPKGRAVLTNKRLLFVSSGGDQESTLAADKKVGLQSLYNLSSESKNLICFFPITLASINWVMLSSTASSKWSSSIKGLLTCTALCGQSEEVTRWNYEQPTNVVRNVRIVRLGVLMPPFDKPMVADIMLAGGFSIRTAAEFVGKVQSSITPTEQVD